MKASACDGGGGSGGGSVVLSWLSVQMHHRGIDDEVRLCSCRNNSGRYSLNNDRKNAAS